MTYQLIQFRREWNGDNAIQMPGTAQPVVPMSKHDGFRRDPMFRSRALR